MTDNLNSIAPVQKKKSLALQFTEDTKKQIALEANISNNNSAVARKY